VILNKVSKNAMVSNPRHHSRKTKMPKNNHVTIEQTGKSLKLQKVLATLTLVLGLIIVAVGFQYASPEASRKTIANGWLTLAGGAVWFLSAKALSWWHHG
jgi:hypothetical protein